MRFRGLEVLRFSGLRGGAGDEPVVHGLLTHAADTQCNLFNVLPVNHVVSSPFCWLTQKPVNGPRQHLAFLITCLECFSISVFQYFSADHLSGRINKILGKWIHSSRARAQLIRIRVNMHGRFGIAPLGALSHR